MAPTRNVGREYYEYETSAKKRVQNQHITRTNINKTRPPSMGVQSQHITRLNDAITGNHGDNRQRQTPTYPRNTT